MKKDRKTLPKGVESFTASLISIAFGLLLGFVLLLVFNAPKALHGLRNIMFTGFADTGKFAKVLYTAAPIMLTGLSVGFAFKTGLFNIGATGQYTVGAAFGLAAAVLWQAPWWLCLLVSMVGGALWGAIPGICKAFFNVNEVITSIMFNWIGLFAVNLFMYNTPLMLANAWGDITKERTANLAKAAPQALIPKLGLDAVFRSPYINIGIIIALATAVVIWFVLQKTTFGFELKASGYNRHASRYAGISTKRNIVLSMTIAGALAGLGGGVYFLAGPAQYTMVKQLLTAGFNGIPVALLAASHPLGTVFSALFISYIQVGGDAMQPEFAKEIIDIIIAAIIYLSAFSLLMRELLRRWQARRAEARDGEDKQ